VCRGVAMESCCLLMTQWRRCMFSGDAEFIVVGSHRQHKLYIWDKAIGSLVKMLTGQEGGYSSKNIMMILSFMLTPSCLSSSVAPHASHHPLHIQWCGEHVVSDGCGTVECLCPQLEGARGVRGKGG